MHRLALPALALFALAACDPQVPDSGQSVGFQSYPDYMRQQQQAGYGRPMASGPGIGTETVTATPIGGTGGAIPLPPPIQSTTTGERPRGDIIAGIKRETGETAHYGGTGLSDEQNFDAVAARESIQSDAERLRQQREQYVVVQPTAVPQRSGDSGPNIVAFALSTQHAPGTKMYSRSSFRLRPYEVACAPFTSSDLAQEEFLRRGGPNRDPMGVDPDGDGFACGWDPRPFRAALK